MPRSSISPGEKLALLRESDRLRPWEGLKERCQCVLCERVFSGRRVRPEETPDGHFTIHCPTPGCASTPREWLRRGDPLVDDRVWRDWLQIFDEEDGRLRVAEASTHQTAHYAD